MPVDIREIAPITREVIIGDAAVEVRGISLRNFASLTLRFPALLTWWSGANVDPVELLTALPDAAVAIMAGGLGKAGDGEIEAALDGWAFGQQAELLNAVLGLTFGGEKALPFVQMLLGAAARAARDQSPPSTSASSSPEQSPS